MLTMLVLGFVIGFGAARIFGMAGYDDSPQVAEDMERKKREESMSAYLEEKSRLMRKYESFAREACEGIGRRRGSEIGDGAQDRQG